MDLKTKLTYSPEWDFDTFVEENYKLTHTDLQKRNMFIQFTYCKDNYNEILRKKKHELFWETRKKLEEERAMNGDNSILGNPSY